MCFLGMEVEGKAASELEFERRLESWVYLIGVLLTSHEDFSMTVLPLPSSLILSGKFLC